MFSWGCFLLVAKEFALGLKTVKRAGGRKRLGLQQRNEATPVEHPHQGRIWRSQMCFDWTSGGGFFAEWHSTNGVGDGSLDRAGVALEKG
jgi:hypothetical protein